MIVGSVNDSLEPVVELHLVRAGLTTAISAVVDTGFSGDLCLSRDWIEAMDLEFSYVGRYELADGTIVTKDVFTGQAEFDGELRDVEVILTDSADTLIGGSMMKRHVLTVDYTRSIVHIETPPSADASLQAEEE